MRWHEPSAEDPTLPQAPASGNETTLASGGARPSGRVLVEGTPVGRFVVESLLGSGGMGAVYRALDPQLGRSVALKLLHRAGDGSVAEAGQQRLLREAQAMARVAHPNLVMVFEVGSHEGQVYIAMELVQGTTLRTWLDAERRPVAEILRVFGEAGRGLAAAHAAGLVHRDFKPANVLVSPGGRVQVTDFGLARSTEVVDAQGPTRPVDAFAVHLTQTGALMGTPAYMAPEQFEGGPTDARTDEFAFCVSLFEALYGQRPFRGETTVALMTSVLAGAIVPPPPRREVPRRLYEVLARGMSRRPEDRYPDLAGVLAALDDSGRARGSRGAWLAGGAFAIAGLAATPFMLSALDDSPKSGSKARPREERPRVDRAPAQTPPAEPGLGLVEPEAGLRTIAEHHAQKRFRGSVARWRAAHDDFERACAQAGAPLRWCAAAPFSSGMAKLLRDEHAEARTSFESAIALDSTWSAPHLGRAAALIQLGQLDLALDAATEAQRLEPEWVLPLRMAADVHISANRFDDAVAELRRALELDPTAPGVHSDLALVHHAQGLDSEALRHAEKALALDAEDLSALVLLAERALEDGEFERALELASQASAVHPTSVPAWLARGDALVLLGKPAKARDAYEKALAAAQAMPDHGADADRLEATRLALAAGTLPTPILGPEPEGGADDQSGRSSKSGRKPTGGRSKKGKGNKGAADDPLDGLDGL